MKHLDFWLLLFLSFSLYILEIPSSSCFVLVILAVTFHAILMGRFYHCMAICGRIGRGADDTNTGVCRNATNIGHKVRYWLQRAFCLVQSLIYT